MFQGKGNQNQVLGDDDFPYVYDNPDNGQVVIVTRSLEGSYRTFVFEGNSTTDTCKWRITYKEHLNSAENDRMHIEVNRDYTDAMEGLCGNNNCERPDDRDGCGPVDPDIIDPLERLVHGAATCDVENYQEWHDFNNHWYHC